MVLPSANSRQITKKRVLRSSNSENTPPSKLRRVSTSIREASRRRRARVTSGTNTSHITHKARYTSDVKSRKAKPGFGGRMRFRVVIPRLPTPVVAQDIEMKEAEALNVRVTDVPPIMQKASVTLPRHLPRPEFKDIDKKILEAIEPEFANTPVEYIQDGLEVMGPECVLKSSQVSRFDLTNSVPQHVQSLGRCQARALDKYFAQGTCDHRKRLII
jgi:hypothetical protein